MTLQTQAGPHYVFPYEQALTSKPCDEVTLILMSQRQRVSALEDPIRSGRLGKGTAGPRVCHCHFPAAPVVHFSNHFDGLDGAFGNIAVTSGKAQEKHRKETLLLRQNHRLSTWGLNTDLRQEWKNGFSEGGSIIVVQTQTGQV